MKNANKSSCNTAAATAAFGFTRNLATAMSVVIGGALYQNMVSNQLPQYSGSSADAGAAVSIVKLLPPGPRLQFQNAIVEALKDTWILYTVVSALGFVVAYFVSSQTLSKQHTETKTGLEAQEEARQDRLREKEEKRASRQAKDVEKGEQKRASRMSKESERSPEGRESIEAVEESPHKEIKA